MIYDYYCVDCGRKIPGNAIQFDLAQFLEMDVGNSSEERIALISSSQLKEIASACRERLQEQSTVKLKVTLKQMLDIMVEFSKKKKYVQGSIETDNYINLQEILEAVFAGASASQAMISQMAFDYAKELRARFTFDDEGREPEEEELNDTKRYCAYFWIKPFFLENGMSSDLYTVQYRVAERDEKTPPVTLMDIVLNTEIRGYCPECGKPVLLHTGQVPHIMVGLLGAQSAGKTSLIVSMINHIQNYYNDLGIEYPNNPLCDSKYRYMMRNLKLYEYGWAME